MPQRHPARPEVFEEHARSFEALAEDERRLTYDRSVDTEQWVAHARLRSE
jgi:hypothetical protein